MTIGATGAGGPRPHRPVGGPGEAKGPEKTGKAFEVGPEQAAEGAAPARGSESMEELRRIVGTVPKDTDAAALEMVRGLLKAELGPAAAEEPGFEKMAAAVADKVGQDPLLGEKLKKVLSELARP